MAFDFCFYLKKIDAFILNVFVVCCARFNSCCFFSFRCTFSHFHISIHFSHHFKQCHTHTCTPAIALFICTWRIFSYSHITLSMSSFVLQHITLDYFHGNFAVFISAVIIRKIYVYILTTSLRIYLFIFFIFSIFCEIHLRLILLVSHVFCYGMQLESNRVTVLFLSFFLSVLCLVAGFLLLLTHKSLFIFNSFLFGFWFNYRYAFLSLVFFFFHLTFLRCDFCLCVVTRIK